MAENVNPVGRIYCADSTLICMPALHRQEVALALGAQASEFRLRDAIIPGGFDEVRHATETPFNIVLEALT